MLTTNDTQRFIVTTRHSEYQTVFYVIDTAQPEEEQPAVVMSFGAREEPNARFLAEDFCRRHNGLAHGCD